MSNYVPGQGNPSAKLMVVGEAPGAVEDQLLRPFAGPSGNLLNELLEEAGTHRREVYVTNVVKYRPPQNDLRRLDQIGHSVEEGMVQLWEEINALKPNCILALGNLSLKALTGMGTYIKKSGKYSGILTWRGSILRAMQGDYKVLPTIHPAALLRSGDTEEKVLSYSSRLYILNDIKRAVAQSQFREFRLPPRTLEIARSRVDVWRFLEKYKHLKKVSVDIEVLAAIPVCIALSFNTWHAMSIPLMDIWALQNKESGIADHEFDYMWQMLMEFLGQPDIQVIGQNFKFDDEKLRRACGIVVKNTWFDNMMAAHTLHCELPRSQAFLTSIYTDEPYYKDEGKEFNIKKSPCEQLLYYNAKDAVVAFEIHEQLYEAMGEINPPGFPNWRQSFFFDHVMPLHDLYRDMEDEGFPVDEEKRKELIKDYEQKIVDAKRELEAIVGWDVNPNSPKQVGLLLYKDFALPARGKRTPEGIKTSTDEDTLTALQANVCKKPEHKRAIDLILKLRGWHKALGTYIKAACDFDGRMRTSIQICGTETGRSSNKKQEAPVRPFKMGLAFQTMSKHGEMGAELRKMFIAEPGHSIMEFDLSQAEARVVALLGRSEETLRLFNTTDIHKLTSTWLFNFPMNQISKEMRFVGKTCRHAGNYDMRKRRLMEIINTDAKKYNIDISPVSEWKAGKMLDTFHEFSPWIREVFHKEIVQALQENNLTLVNPFGRVRQFCDHWGDELWREAYAQIPQSTIPDHIRRAAINLRRRVPGIRIILEAHDALVFMTPNHLIEPHARIIKEEFETPIDFRHCTLSRGELIIPCEAKFGQNYKQLNDLDLKQVA